MAVDEKQGATWAANAINSFHGWALISKDEAGSWTLMVILTAKNNHI
jgi:hypothetical protein